MTATAREAMNDIVRQLGDGLAEQIAILVNEYGWTDKQARTALAAVLGVAPDEQRAPAARKQVPVHPNSDPSFWTVSAQLDGGDYIDLDVHPRSSVEEAGRSLRHVVDQQRGTDTVITAMQLHPSATGGPR